MANKKENKIILLNNATLTYNGEVLTEETIKNVPTEALTQFFVGHFAKNYPFGDIVWAIGKELKSRIDQPKTQSVGIELASLATSEQAEDIVNGLNPYKEDGTRTYDLDECVKSAEDIANAEKLRYSVNLACLELVNARMQAEKDREKIAELEAEREQLSKEIANRDEQHSVVVNNQQNQTPKKKTKKTVMIFATIILGVSLLATSLGFNIAQGAANRDLRGNIASISAENERKDQTIADQQAFIADQQAFIDSIKDLAERLGYEEGMKDENGNVITIQVFLERKASEDEASLKQEIAGMKQTLRDLGYEVDDGKTLSGIVKDVYDAFQEDKKNAIANEVMSSYFHFANLLEDLGINPEEIVDANGNLDTSKFDSDVSAIVKGALNNANHLKQVQDKIDASFKALGVTKTNENGETVYKSATDYANFADAITDIENAYGEKYEALKDSVAKSIDNAFAVTGIKKADGTVYSSKDFKTLEKAIDKLAEECDEKFQGYIDLIDEKNDKIDELEVKLGETIDLLDKAYAEIDDLNNKIENLNQKIKDQEKANEDQNNSGKEDNGGKVGPVAGEDKDQDNTGGSPRPGQREDGNDSSNDYDNADENSL